MSLMGDLTDEYLKLNSFLAGNKVNVVPLDLNTQLDGLWEAQTKYQSENTSGDDLVYKYMGYGPYTSKEEFRSTVENNILSCTDGKIFGYAIELREPKQIIGFTTFWRIYPAHRTCEIGHVWLDPRFRRQNLLDEAVWLMTRHAIENVGYRRVEWKCNNGNAASKKMAERNQFTFEGVHRQCVIVKGANRDTAWYSIIDEPEEWNRVKEIQTKKFNC